MLISGVLARTAFIGPSRAAGRLLVLFAIVLGCGESGGADGRDAPNAGTGSVGASTNAGRGGTTPGGSGGTATGGSGGTATGGSGGIATGGSGGTATGGASAGVGGNSVAGSTFAGGGGTGGADGFEPERWMDGCVPKGPELLDVPGIELLASEADSFDTLSVLESAFGHLYFGDSRLRRVALDTRQVETVIETGLQGLAVGPDAAYFVQNSNLYAASLASLPAEPDLILEGVRSETLLVDDTHVYFQRTNPQSYVRLAFENVVPSAEPATVVLDMFLVAPRIRDGVLYFADSSTLYRVPVAGGTPEAVGATGPEAVDTDGETLFFTSDERLYRKPMISPPNGTEWTLLAAGNRLLEGSNAREALAPIELVGDRVYYREDSGALAWVKTDGSDCRIVAQPAYVVSETLDFVVDESFIYLVHDGSELYSIPRME
jgi:hypothetical protein